MTAPGNLSFETADSTPGSALLWSVSVTSSAEEVADFDSVSIPYEPFDGWVSPFTFTFIGPPPAVDSDLELPDLTTLSVNPKTTEDFEELWLADQTSLFVLDSPVAATFVRQYLGMTPFGNYTPPQAIPDNSAPGVVLDAVLASVPAGTSGFNIFINVTHAHPADLQLTLLAPNGTGTAGNAYNQTGVALTPAVVLDPSADFEIPNAVPSPIGTWHLKVADLVATNTGSVQTGAELWLLSARPTVETFEFGWSNAPTGLVRTEYLLNTDAASYESAFGPGDDLESWAVGFFDTFVGPPTDLEVAPFEPGAANQERFEAVAPTIVGIGVTVGSDVFSATGHNFVTDDAVIFSGVTLPAPLSHGVQYFIRDEVPGVSFKVSATLGGGVLDITSVGSFDLTVTGDPTVYWLTAISI